MLPGPAPSFVCTCTHGRELLAAASAALAAEHILCEWLIDGCGAGDLPEELRKAGYQLYPCYNKQNQACGCLQPMSHPPQGNHQCKVHGHKADFGAAAVLNSFTEKGYLRPVLVQWPVLHGKGSRGQTTRGFAAGVKYRFDLVLKKLNSEDLVAVEVQGTSHSNSQAKENDKLKVENANSKGMSIYQIAVTSKRNAVRYEANETVAGHRSRPKRLRHMPARYDESVTSLDAMAQAVMNELRSHGCRNLYLEVDVE